MILFVLLSALVGMTLIVTSSTLFRPLRRIGPAMLRCPQCIGFWIGAAASASGVVSVGQALVLDAAIIGAATSLWATLVNAILLQLLGEVIE